MDCKEEFNCMEKGLIFILRRSRPKLKESPKAVINECLAGASDAVIATLPKISSLATTIKRKRRLQEEIYKRALTCVLNSIGERRPMMFIIDFEKSVENVIRSLIPQTHVAGCWFHFNQSIWQSIQNLGLNTRFDQEPEYALALKKFSVLALCDVQ
uniref:MULE transposase domain-containing protein n=1 Tax=Meloidogyne javanica TaxID=6303 RepID=A0A915N5Z4_MELJA